MIRVLLCWFRGHNWRYDRHIWGSGLEAADRFVCGRCGTDHVEPAGSVLAAPPADSRSAVPA